MSTIEEKYTKANPESKEIPDSKVLMDWANDELDNLLCMIKNMRYCLGVLDAALCQNALEYTYYKPINQSRELIDDASEKLGL